MITAEYSFGDLRVLRGVAARGSFTAAASELGYTQSAISKRVAALERTTGHTLVTRERKGVRLTPAGEVLLGHAATALEAMEKAGRELDGADAIRLRPVRLGAFASAAAGVLTGALERLRRDRLDIEVALREGTSAVLTRALRAGSLAQHRRFGARMRRAWFERLRHATSRRSAGCRTATHERGVPRTGRSCGIRVCEHCPRWSGCGGRWRLVWLGVSAMISAWVPCF